MRPSEASGYASPVRDVLVNSKPSSPSPRAGTRLTRRQFLDVFTALDAIIVLASSILAKHLYTAYWAGQFTIASDYILVGGIAALIHYLMIRAERDEAEQFRHDPPHRVLRRLAMTFAVVIVLGYGLKQAEAYSRIWLALSLAIAFVGIVLKNRLALELIRRSRQSEYFVERIALYGDPAIAEPLKRSLEIELDQLARITTYAAEISEATLKPAGSAVLTQLIADGLNNNYNRIVFCVPPAKLDHLKALAAAIDFLPVQIQACPVPPELLGRRPDLAFSPEQFLINLDERPQDDWGVIVKRAVDLGLGTVFLLAAAPLMILAAIAIKLDSKGPVLFRQRRHGLNHAVITVLKLRTMIVTEDGATVTQARHGDPRITRVGRFLRRTSLDELPQLINVLRGEMSLVGPRPHALAHNLYYTDLIASYATRHKVKPGITGWAQVKGLRGNSEDIARMAARAEADIWYIRNWSTLLDLKIIFITPFVFLFQRNAC